MATPANRVASQDMRRAEELLRTAPLAFVSVVDGDAPYVVPMSFAFMPDPPETRGSAGPHASSLATLSIGQILLHSGAGRKAEALALDPRVCVAVVADPTFVRGDTPCRDGFSFRSVLIEGRATLLDDPARRHQALQALVTKYDEVSAEMPFEEDALGQTLVYAIEIDTLSYKERRGPGNAARGPLDSTSPPCRSTEPLSP